MSLCFTVFVFVLFFGVVLLKSAFLLISLCRVFTGVWCSIKNSVLFNLSCALISFQTASSQICLSFLFLLSLSLSLSLSLCLSVSVSVSVSVSLSLSLSLSLFPPFCLSLPVSFLSLSVPVCSSVSVCLSVSHLVLFAFVLLCLSL